MSPGTPVRDPDEVRRVDLYLSGFSLGEVAKVCGVSRQAVWLTLEKYGVPRRDRRRRKPSLPTEKIARAVARHQAGMSFAAAGASEGISGQTVFRYARDGVPVTPTVANVEHATQAVRELKRRGRPRIPGATLARAIALYEAGASIQAASEAVGVSYQTIRNALISAGVTRQRSLT